jgi:hypothetical protein
MLGHQVGYWQWIGEHFEREMKSGREVTFEELERAFGKGFEERTKKYWGTMIEEVLPAFEAAVKFALQRAVDQEFHVMAKFFAAFSRALARKPSLRLGVGRTSTGIYWVMLTSWRRVEEFGSVPELHRRLCACIYLGSHVVGDLKRVEKICERMGLSYKEIESRKERAKNPDMNA